MDSELSRKNIIVALSGADQRLATIDQLKNELTSNGYQVLALPDMLKSYEKYLHQAMKTFPMKSPLKIAKEEMSLDQIDDVQLDWITGGEKIAIVIPELQHLRKRDAYGFKKLVSVYLTKSVALWDSGGKKSFRFLFSINELPLDFFAGLELYIGTANHRSISEIAMQHIAILR